MRALIPRGFAISADAVFALLVLLAILGFIGIGVLNPEEQMSVTKTDILSQNLEDALTAMENTGFLPNRLDPAPDQNKTDEIHAKLTELLPTNTKANIKVLKYKQKSDLTACRTTHEFDDCFEYESLIESGDTIPTTGEVLAGKKLVLQKAAGIKVGGQIQCEMSSGLKEKKSIEELFKISFQGGDPIQLNTIVEDDDGVPYGEGHALDCYDPDATPAQQKTQIAHVTLEALSGVRENIKVMLLMDRSGSMEEYDMIVQHDTGVADAGTCNGVACSGCPISKDTDYDDFTDKQTVTTYNLSDLGTVPSSNEISFVVIPNEYNGDCDLLNSMVLWVERPDAFIEKDSGELTSEDVSNPALGNYTIIMWDDSTANSGLGDAYSGIYVTKGSEQTINFNNFNDGWRWWWFYLGWDQIDTVSVPAYSYKATFDFTYSDYTGSRAPRFRIENGWSTWGDIACGADGAASGSCQITVVDNNPSGPYATAGNYEIWGWSDEDIDGTVTVTIKYLDNIAGSGYIGNGTCESGSCGGCPTGTQAATPTPATDVRTLGTFTILDTVESHFRGIYADINSLQVSPTATCNAGLGFTNPYEATQNWYFSFPPGADSIFCFQLYSGSWECSNDRKSVGVPLQAANYSVLGWSDKTFSYDLLWRAQRIDGAKRAAKIFLNDALWKDGDEFGLASYSTSPSTNRNLTDHSNIQLVKNSLNTLVPSGWTGMAEGIDEAADELRGEEGLKFIVLLTDGVANCTKTGSCDAPQCPSNNSWPCVEDAIEEAEDARTDEITTFVIGIADHSIFDDTVPCTGGGCPGITYQTALGQLAKDPCVNEAHDTDGTCTYGVKPGYDACFDAFGKPVETEYCGAYYYAGNEDQLSTIYDLIAEEIGRRIGSVDIHIEFTENTEVLCESSCTEGELYCEYDSTGDGAINCTSNIPIGCSIPADCDGEEADSWHTVGEEIMFVTQDIGVQWQETLTTRIPCGSEECEEEELPFPADESYIETAESGDVPWAIGPDTICNPDCQVDVPFHYNDLKLDITGGTVISQNSVEATVEINNRGFQSNDFDDRLLVIGFYQNNPPPAGTHVDLSDAGSATGGFATALTGGNDLQVTGGILDPGETIEISGIVVEENDLLYAHIEEVNLSQCTLNDNDWMACGEPEMYYYILEYAVWLEG